MLAQDAPHITHFWRQCDNWVRSDYGDLAASVSLPSIECMLTLRNVYLGVTFE